MAEPAVGIDLTDRRLWAHLDDAAVRRAAARWLRPAERRWCRGEPSFREAVTVVLTCKEAVFKAGGAPAVHAVSLAMIGGDGSGWAVTAGGRAGSVVARWALLPDTVLAVAVAGPDARRTLGGLLETAVFCALRCPDEVDSTRAISNSAARLRHLCLSPPGAGASQADAPTHCIVSASKAWIL